MTGEEEMASNTQRLNSGMVAFCYLTAKLATFQPTHVRAQVRDSTLHPDVNLSDTAHIHHGSPPSLHMVLEDALQDLGDFDCGEQGRSAKWWRVSFESWLLASSGALVYTFGGAEMVPRVEECAKDGIGGQRVNEG